MIRALIFDFNGVLADDDPIHMEALRRVAEEEGLSFTDQDYLDRYLPLNDWDCFRAIHAEHSISLPAGKLEELIRRKGVYYFEAIAEKSVMFEPAPAAIRAAAERCQLAIASGARAGEIRHILTNANLLGCFKTVVAAEDVQMGKPHPEPFRRAYERLREGQASLEPGDCVAVEDSIGGIQSAHEAGMRCLAVAHSYGRDRLGAARPEWVIDSIADFIAWLKKEVPK